MLLLFVSCIFWSLLMFLLQKYHKDDLKYNSYIVAFMHGLISSRCCELVWYMEESMKFEKFGSDLTVPQYWVISLSAGYFLYDTIICLRTNEKVYYIVHHFITFLTLIYVLLEKKCGPELILAIWTAEGSGPCLNLRYFFENSRFKSSRWSLVNDIVFVVLFLILRFGLGSLMMYKLYWSVNTFIVIKTGGFLFFSFHLFLFGVICFSFKDVFMKYKSDFSVKTS